MSSKCRSCGSRIGFGGGSLIGIHGRGGKGTKLKDITPAFDAKPAFDLVAHLERQKAFSLKTFGPGQRTDGVLDHIRKELKEIEENPSDVVEWIDVVLLALDGAWRAGFTPEQIASALEAKQQKNENRNWPDWTTVPEGQAITHIKS